MCKSICVGDDQSTGCIKSLEEIFVRSKNLKSEDNLTNYEGQVETT